MASKTIFDEIRDSKVGDVISLFNEKRKYKVMARSKRFVILSKPCFGKALYTIFDFKDKWIAPDNLVFGCYDYLSREDCEKALEALEKGELELSFRHGLSFGAYSSRFEKEESNG